MDRIRTGLEVILALFLELRLLKKLTHYIFLAVQQPSKPTLSHRPEVLSPTFKYFDCVQAPNGWCTGDRAFK